ncbi:MAG TPA: PGPGW domain-containing protein [Kofleriaceae bacterium]
MGALAELKHEWHHFRVDSPGTRFENHRARMKKKSRSHHFIFLGLGIVLLIVGIVLLFMPGPGLPLIVFGLALVASHSHRLTKLLDRAEPPLRKAGHRTIRTWQALPGRAKLGVVIGLAAFARAGMLFMWRFVVSAYLLG